MGKGNLQGIFLEKIPCNPQKLFRYFATKLQKGIYPSGASSIFAVNLWR